MQMGVHQRSRLYREVETAGMTGNITPQQGQAALATWRSDVKAQAQNGQAGQLSEDAGHGNARWWGVAWRGAIVNEKNRIVTHKTDRERRRS